MGRVMPVPAIKICGLSTPETVDAALTARAAYLGFNFYPPSPRYVTVEQVAALAARAASRAVRVGVFVDPADDALATAMASGMLDVLQLHGNESPQRLAAIKARFGCPVWKALAVAGPADLQHAAAFRGIADLVLFDAKTPKGGLPGGMGLTFDWALLADRPSAMAWGLAGGLTPLTVAQAIRQTGAPLVDTASGVETAPGIKDPALIAAFCTAARAG
jgi:phosphoribosylanthranilate isomerase